ncbi:MAG: tetratricopeptide repeat protein [Planctomycetota bacterium]
MKRLGCLAAVLCVVFASVGGWLYQSSLAASSLDQMIQQGDRALASRRLDVARRVYEKAYEFSDSGGIAALRMAQVSRVENDAQGTSDWLDRAQSEGADPEQIRLQKKLMEVQTGAAQRLLRRLDVYLDQAGDAAAQVYDAYAMGFAAKQNSVAAGRIIDQWLKADPDSALARLRRGQTLMQRGDVATAKETFAEAVKRDPNLLDAHLGLVQAAMADEEPQTALRHIRIASAALPENFRVRLMYADLLTQSRQFAAAASQLEWLRRQQPDHFAVTYSLARYYVDHGKPEKAIEVLGEMTERLPDDVALNYLLARAHEDAGNSEKSREYLDRHLAGRQQLDKLDLLRGRAESGGASPVEKRTLALGYLPLQWDASERWLQECLSLQPNDPELHEAMSRFWWLNGNEHLAKQFAENANRLKQM